MISIEMMMALVGVWLLEGMIQKLKVKVIVVAHTGLS